MYRCYCTDIDVLSYRYHDTIFSALKYAIEYNWEQVVETELAETLWINPWFNGDE